MSPLAEVRYTAKVPFTLNGIVTQLKLDGLKLDKLDFQRWSQIPLVGVLVMAWWVANRGSLHVVAAALAESSSLTRLCLVLLIAGVVVWTGRSRPDGIQRWVDCALRPWPLTFMLGSLLLGSVGQWWFQDDTVTGLTVCLGSYGLLGLVLAPVVWQRGIPLAALLGALLMGMPLGTGLGFPLRVVTASVVERVLAQAHLGAISSQDIIVLENGIAHVDLPCSGLKSLGMGLVFLLVCTILERRRLGFAWLGIAAGGSGLLVIANSVRVLVLVLVGLVAQQPRLADLLHLPLGVLGFIFACGLMLWLLQRIPTLPELPTVAQPSRSLPLLPTAALAAFLLIWTLLPFPALASPQPPLSPPLNWSTSIQVESIPLSEVEQGFFAHTPGTWASKERFQAGSLSGSWLIVASPSWRSHHAPELCLQGSGFKVDRMKSVVLGTGHPARWLSLQQGSRSALYWFQSQETITDDLATRVWEEFSRRQRGWVMVSMLFDNLLDPQDPAIQSLVDSVQTTLATQWKGSSL